MFPNLRLIIVATMASILGISCGLGVFAAFHVNRDPILLSPTGAPPLLSSHSAFMGPSEPRAAEPFDTRVTVALPQASVASTEQPLRASGPAPNPTLSQVNSMVEGAVEPPESADTEATVNVASTEATKAESTTTDDARLEMTEAEAKIADAASTEIAKAEANTELIKAEETKPGDASKLSLGDSNKVAPPPSSVNGEKTVRPASTKIRAVQGKTHAKTKSVKVRAKAARTRVTHTKLLRSRPSAVVQFADQSFTAQPMYQWPTQPLKPVTIHRGRHGRSRYMARTR